MYILKLFDIDVWLYKVCINIYSFAADVYQFIIELAGTEIMSSDSIKAYAGNISVLVGVIALFKIAVSLLTYMVDPDSIDDKTIGSNKLITGILVAMVLLITYQLAFGALRTIQQAILNTKNKDNFLVRLFSGNNTGEIADQYTNGLICTYKGGDLPWDVSGKTFDFTVALQNNSTGGKVYTKFTELSTKYLIGISYDKGRTSFKKYDSNGKEVTPLFNLKTYEPTIYVAVDSDNITSSIDSVNGRNQLLKCPSYVSVKLRTSYPHEVYLLTMSDVSTSNYASLASQKENTYTNDAGRALAGSLLFSFVDCDGEDCDIYNDCVKKNDIAGAYDAIVDTSTNEIKSNVEFKSILALIFGVVLLLFLVTTTADVAVRAIKLIVLEVLAPFPILCYSDPKTRNVFDSWIKTVGVTYADIFVRIIIIAVCNFLVTKSEIPYIANTLIRLMFLIGILLFLKEAPQFICNAFGIKAQGLGNFTLNPMDKLRQVPVVGSAVTAAGGFATNAWSTLRSGGSVGDVISAGFEGAGSGWRRNGGMSSSGKETAPGFLGRTRQATVQAQKSRDEKNRQASRDRALYTMADQVNGIGGRSNADYEAMGKGKAVYTANPISGHTLHDHSENIENNTRP